MLLAYTRAVSPAIDRCELTHLERVPIDAARAAAEHAAYEALLARLGLKVRHLPPTPSLPDGVFVEDAAVVLDEVAVITRPGAPSRRPEVASVENALGEHRELRRIADPATLDGGDVLVVGRKLYVGLSRRTTKEGAGQLDSLLRPFGYEVVPVKFRGCLHLKSGVTRVDEDLLLLNPAWVEPSLFPSCRRVEVCPGEPHAANALALPAGVVFPGQYPGTRDRLEREGLVVHTLDTRELAKAEAGVTCCSLLVRVA